MLLTAFQKSNASAKQLLDTKFMKVHYFSDPFQLFQLFLEDYFLCYPRKLRKYVEDLQVEDAFNMKTKLSPFVLEHRPKPLSEQDWTTTETSQM